MKTLARFGEFEVVAMDSPRHRHRGIPQFAVRDAQQNYSAYCRSAQEAEAKAKTLDEQNRKEGPHGKALGS